MRVHQVEVEDLRSPFAEAAPNLSELELQETAYEILVGACRSSGPKPLTFVSHSNRGDKRNPSASLYRSLSLTASSEVKKKLGLKTTSSRRSKKAVTMGELMRVQMRVSEVTDTRVRRALLRVAAGQLGRRIESMVLPLELIQQLKCSDFPSEQDYEAWLRRNLKVLEAGLLLHPLLPLDRKDICALRMQHIIHVGLEKPMEIGKDNEAMQTLRSVVMSLAWRSFDESVPQTCHWADGFPLNLRIYQTLLEACFDNHDDTWVIDEVDEVLELIKTTWVMLGMNEMLHNVCFSWVFFQRYVATGQMENDLLFASSNLLAEAEKDVKAMNDPLYSKSLSSILNLMLSWAEERLLAYHDNFLNGNIESMPSVVSIAVSSAKILAEDIFLECNRVRKEADVSLTRVENYITSSLHAAFQKLEKLDPRNSKHVPRQQDQAFLSLTVLAQKLSELAFNEKAIYSPILKRWHPLAAGVAVATLHVCYGHELKQYVRSVTELTPDAVEMLMAADKLEKDLVQIAVEDSVDSEDGGKSVIREIYPYEAEAVIVNLVKSWIKTRVDRLEEWVDTNLQEEVWNPHANKVCFAPSAAEILRIIHDSLEAFFLLPIPMHVVLLPELMSGLDKSLQQYILKAKSGCGNRNTFIPIMPALTRCSTGSKFNGVFRKKEKSQVTQRRMFRVGTTKADSSFGLPQLCVRINTMLRIGMELKVLEKRTLSRIGSSKSTKEDGIEERLKFKLSIAASVEGIHQLSEAMAYKVIFQDLCHVLWEGLYVGEVSSTRIQPFLKELDQCLKIIVSTVHNRAITHVITELMKASFDGFLLVLLAGGPARAFSLEDHAIIEEDLKLLTDLFWSNGDGLPADLIEKHCTTVKAVLALFSVDTEHLIELLSQLILETYGASAKSRFPLPPTSGQWNPREPNTLLRVLCHRNDDIAAKFLKKNCNLPKKV
ncbi:protein unc-13 homolog isoform X2 [Abrus precatorius]|uniref:Protein unc-13 homolog isoform X2 n=1 Tax=Abrus precatorius TaxID=3816 RepID=A0A8B8KK91_ABRPR|nr:protein unc-13 homolog isoform X2 [Abrus precatorius]